MFSWENALIGAGLIAAGTAMVKYTLAIRDFTGPQDWLEQYTGAGSTYGIYKIFGLIVAFFGILVLTGLGAPFMTWLLSPLRNMFGGLSR